MRRLRNSGSSSSSLKICERQLYKQGPLCLTKVIDNVKIITSTELVVPYLSKNCPQLGSQWNLTIKRAGKMQTVFLSPQIFTSSCKTSRINSPRTWHVHGRLERQPFPSGHFCAWGFELGKASITDHSTAPTLIQLRSCGSSSSWPERSFSFEVEKRNLSKRLLSVPWGERSKVHGETVIEVSMSLEQRHKTGRGEKVVVLI